jgi:tetratricopeptide (TPR) repeat protein
MLSTDFPETDRYLFRRRLGAGAIGVVFGAFDNDSQVEVALKVLQRMDSDAILQIKHEFRSLAEVSHPNLVSLYELASVGRSWFFTMELVDGIDFRTWVADPPAAAGSAIAPRGEPSLEVNRLRSALRQLAEAITCVHAAGKLHRDVKPTNVLVTPSGRVVLLDFGLVRSHVLEVRAAGDGPGITISGTPEYIAPELVLGGAPAPAADWYSVGAMLYEALVGRLPFEGDAQAVLHQKLSRTPPDARALAPFRARDLADLAMRLLAREADRRPRAQEVLDVLGADERRGFAARSPAIEQERLFVGRGAHLHELHQAFGACTKGRAVVALVSGRSGVGKSSLCRRFLEEVAPHPSRPLVLEARCHERESVPHKTLDGFVDALASELSGWPAAEREALRPTDHEVLGRMFPALGPFWPVTPGTGPSGEGASDPRTLRRRAAAALRQVVASLARRRPLVVHIDDLQWGDADSIEILGALLADGIDPVLWILSHRSEDEARTETLVAMQTMLKACGARLHHLLVGPLSPEDSVSLALRLLGGGGDPRARLRAESLAREAAGSPLFLSELARFERDLTATLRPSGAASVFTLDDLLRARISFLAEPSRKLLTLLAVAGRPLPQRVWREAGDDPGAVVSLRNANLVRTSGIRRDDTAETYHDRIRELVVAMLSLDETRRAHATLAAALQRQGEPSRADLEAIAYHALGAGDAPTALRYSLLAARQARAGYASRDAIRHFEVALSLLQAPEDAAQRHAVEVEAGEACREAGLHERALELLAAALHAATEVPHRAEIRVARGRVLHEKGEFRGAIAELEAALRLLGGRPPGTGARLLAATAAEIVRYAAGRLGWRGRPPPTEALGERQADLLFLLMRIYFFVDAGKIAWSGFAAMNLCRHSRRDETLAYAESGFASLLLGIGLRRRAERHLENAKALAARSGSSLSQGIALGRLGVAQLFVNELDVAAETLGRSVATLRSVSETWEVLTSLMVEATSHFMAGRLDAAERLWREMDVGAAEMASRMHAAWSMSWLPYVGALRGTTSAADARRTLLAALGTSRSVGEVANQVAAVSHLAALAVLVRDRRDAARAALRAAKVFSRYLVQVPFLQVGLVDVAEAALLGLEGASPRRRAALRVVMRRSLRRLAWVARSYPHLRGPTLRVRALEAAHDGRPERARRLALEAVRLLEASPNRLWLLAAYASAADLVPDRRAELRSKAQALRGELGLPPGRESS